jgi:Putative Actinobacterial Holin-X, holin superfamily III
VAAIGAVLALMGYNSLKTAQLAPQETIQTIKEDATWMREQTT